MSKNKTKNDKELFFLMKKDDTDSLKILFEKYFTMLCGFSYNYVKSIDLAEEVVADVFSKIWMTRSRIEINSSLKSYLLSATKNTSINYIAKESKHFESLEVLDRENNYSKNTPDKIYDLHELEDVIETIIKKLPPKRQTVFRMNRVSGLSYKEIAEKLSISVYTVQNHMVKASEFIATQYPKIKSLFIILIFFLL